MDSATGAIVSYFFLLGDWIHFGKKSIHSKAIKMQQNVFSPFSGYLKFSISIYVDSIFLSYNVLPEN